MPEQVTLEDDVKALCDELRFALDKGDLNVFRNRLQEALETVECYYVEN